MENIVISCVLFSSSVVSFTFEFLVLLSRISMNNIFAEVNYCLVKDRSCHLIEVAEPPNCPMNSFSLS